MCSFVLRAFIQQNLIQWLILSIFGRSCEKGSAPWCPWVLRGMCTCSKSEFDLSKTIGRKYLISSFVSIKTKKTTQSWFSDRGLIRLPDERLTNAFGLWKVEITTKIMFKILFIIF